jgi:hypothetical protein
MVIKNIKKNIYSRISIFLSALVLIGFFCIYFNSSSLIRIPVSFTHAETPAVTANIEGKSYAVELDLGSKFQLALDQSVLDSILEKRSSGKANWRDLHGNFYECASYILPRVSIANLVLKNITANQESNDFKKNVTLWRDKEKNVTAVRCSGSLGRPLLEKTNLLLDLQNSEMIACKSSDQLKKAGFLLNRMVQVPFEENGTKGIIIKVDTDLGALKLAIDTGATSTLVRTPNFQVQNKATDERGFQFVDSKMFVIGNRDFGAKKLILYKITPELTFVDGLLGMDFLKKHVVYIDYKNKVVYIGKSQPKSPTQNS